MGKLNVTFTPFVKGEHSLVVVVDNLDHVPTQQEFVSAYFQALTGIDRELIKDAPIEEMPDIDLDEEFHIEDDASVPKPKDDFDIIDEIEEGTENVISNSKMFKAVAQNFLDGKYEGDEKAEVQKAIFEFLKGKFGNIPDIPEYVEKMSKQEVMEFFETYGIAIGDNTKKSAMGDEFSDWDDFVQNGSIKKKKVVITRVMRLYAK